MNIQIRENTNNTTSFNIKNIEANLTNIEGVNIHNDVWSFNVVSKPEGAGDLFHSNNAGEGTYLGYGSTTSPSLDISFPEGKYGKYVLEIIAEIFVIVDGEIQTKVLDEDGNLVDKTVIGKQFLPKFKKINKIEINYLAENEWT